MSKNNTASWKFNGPLSLLQQRAFLLSAIRRFFQTKLVLEVETPVLSSAANTDVHIEMFASQSITANSRASYLRTSPEFFHKRLLAIGAGDLFEIARVFRLGERTSLHNPEFTLLEWYRLDYELFELMDEVVELIQFLRSELQEPELLVEQISYQEVFQRYAGFDPFESSLSELQKICFSHGYTGSELSRTDALDFIFSLVIQPQLNNSQLKPESKPKTGLMIYHFPVEMAALAQVHPTMKDRCLRFEFLWGGVELANGYQELTDAEEQLYRFEQDNLIRSEQGKAILPIDPNLIAALESGLPDCSGVAMGVERLMMCLLGFSSIDQVLGFTAENS